MINFLKAKNTSFQKDAIVLTLSKIVSGMIQIFVTMILSKFRSLQEYGTYTQLILVTNLVSSILMLGLPNSISFFLGRSKDPKTRSDFLSVYFILNTVLAILTGVVLLIFTVPIEFMFENNQISSFWFFLAFYPWAFITTSTMENLAVSSQRTNVLIPYKLLHSFSSISVALISYFLNIDFKLYVLFYLISECIFALFTYLFAFYVGGKFKLHFSKKIVFEILKFSIPLGLASAVGTLNAEIDKFMIGILLNTEEIAIYSNAAKELPFLIITTSITASLLPRFANLSLQNKIEEIIKIWGKGILIGLSIISLFAFGCFVFAEDVIIFLYGDKYLPGINVFRIFCILLLFRSTYWGMLLNASGKTKFILYSSLFSLILNCILNCILYPLFGMEGCAMASILATVLISFAQLFYTCKIMKIRFAKIWPWKKILLLIFINIGFSILFYKIKILSEIDVFVGSFIEALILGFIWAIFYFAVIFFTSRKKEIVQ